MRRKSTPRGVSPRTVGRLSLYRRMLQGLISRGVESIYSRELATLAGVTASQVRGDLMGIGYQGTSSNGYEVKALIKAIGTFLENGRNQSVVLVGVGHLGRAILQYFQRNHPNLQLLASFDKDTELIGRNICGVPVRRLSDLLEFVQENRVSIAIMALPAIGAQEVTDVLVTGGVRSFLNFTNVRLHAPDGVYIEDTDISVSLERVAYYGRQMEAEGP